MCLSNSLRILHVIQCDITFTFFQGNRTIIYDAWEENQMQWYKIYSLNWQQLANKRKFTGHLESFEN